ncbi:YceD family protein [Novosphingobium naphthalenivorans]|uniref:YceD family protein n=1 Tax=Novosphingobium naphthalenivorans TaxID=273168 RepID=UPI00082F7F41|nr:YceD family protein [Novosphingobium naphthalenivorans]
MTAPENAGAEFSRLLDVRQVEGKAAHLEANEAERKALAKRFALVRVDSLSADLELHRSDERTVEARGRLKAHFVQPCAVSGEDLPVSVDEPLFFRFVPEMTGYQPDEEIELTADDCDEIEYTGSHFDLGEAVAQSLGLAIDPYLTGPEADAARKAAGIGTPEDQGPFAALKGLKLGKE